MNPFQVFYGYLQCLFSRKHRRLLFPWYLINDFPSWSKDLDLFFNLTRPALEQHLSSELLVLRKIRESIKYVFLFGSAACADLIIYHAIPLLGFTIPDPIPFYLYLAPWLLALIDSSEIILPYLRLSSRETYGKSKWMTAKRLRNLGYLVFRGELPNGYSYLAPFNSIYDIVLPLKVLFTSRLFCGKPGTGKSATFHSRHLRDAARHGNAIAVDVKGQLFELTAHAFKDFYRLDFRNPELSDRFNLIAACKGNDTLTSQVANYIIVGGNKDSRGDNNKFFYDGAAALLTAVILHLAEGKDPEYPHATMSDVYSILAGGKDQNVVLTNEEYNRKLNAKLLTSHSMRARQTWSAFTSSADPRTLGNILATLYTAIEGFRESSINIVFQSPTPLEAERGCREIDWNFLRGPEHTCLYLVMTAEQSSRLTAIVSTIFGIAMSRLLAELNDPEKNTLKPCYLQIDEGGNFKISGLAEFVAVCRGSSVCVDLSVQSLEQLTTAYGSDYAKQIIEVFGSKIIFPGAEGSTAEYFSEMIGHVTTRERKAVDLPGTALDRNEDREVSRLLLEPEVIRTLAHMQEAVAIINNLEPVRIGFPEFTAVIDHRRSYPTPFFDVVEEEDSFPPRQPQRVSSSPHSRTQWNESPVSHHPLPRAVVPDGQAVLERSLSPEAVATSSYRPTRPSLPGNRPTTEIDQQSQVPESSNQPDIAPDLNPGEFGLDPFEYVPSEADEEEMKALSEINFTSPRPDPPRNPKHSSASGQISYRGMSSDTVIGRFEAETLDAPPPPTTNW